MNDETDGCSPARRRRRRRVTVVGDSEPVVGRRERDRDAGEDEFEDHGDSHGVFVGTCGAIGGVDRFARCGVAEADEFLDAVGGES